MSLVVFCVVPAVLACLTACIAARKRMSLPYMLILSVSVTACSFAFCTLMLLPIERVSLAIKNNGIVFEYGSTALFLCAVLGLFIGLLWGRFVQEKVVPHEREKAISVILRGIAHLFLLLIMLLTKAYLWGMTQHPEAKFDEIIFYLHMPLQGTATGFVNSVVYDVLLPVIVVFLLLMIAVYFPVKKVYALEGKGKRLMSAWPVRLPLKEMYITLCIWYAIMFYLGDQMLNIRGYLQGYFSTSELIEEEYIDPGSVSIIFPPQKRNLITIYLESGETTPQDIENGGVLSENCIPEMTRIAQENTSFSRSELLQGASIPPGCGWTIAGLVAQSAGLPLRMYETDANEGNDGDQFSVMLPGATTLGDILKEEGYRNVFMAGSDFTFGGRRVYYETHGDYEIWDLLTARAEGKIAQDYYQAWGFEDQKLYEYAKEKLMELAAESQPFHFAMLTVDAHEPGFRCELCPTKYIDAERYSLNYADILRCGSMQLDAFLAWLSEQPFYENTTVAITGDHASMQGYFYNGIIDEGYQRNTGETTRLVYNAFINSAVQPVQEKNRVFTTIDFFPTVLASMGVTIEGERLGLGTNLFSSRKTLSEEYGEETFFEELRKRSAFYEERLLYPPKE